MDTMYISCQQPMSSMAGPPLHQDAPLPPFFPSTTAYSLGSCLDSGINSYLDSGLDSGFDSGLDGCLTSPLGNCLPSSLDSHAGSSLDSRLTSPRDTCLHAFTATGYPITYYASPPCTHAHPAMSPYRAKSTSPGSRKASRTSYNSVKQLIDALVTHRVNTLTELRRIEQVAAGCDNEADARAFQEPMTAAWLHYVVGSNQFLTELRGLTPSYPFSSALVADAQQRVLGDPLSNRSWNMAWLCLCKMLDDGLIPLHAAAEACKPEMWAAADDGTAHGSPGSPGSPRYEPSPADCAQLAQCFEAEWMRAVTTMLRHWPSPPTWF